MPKAPEDFDKNDAPPKKRRGRPPGAKNKPSKSKQKDCDQVDNTLDRIRKATDAAETTTTVYPEFYYPDIDPPECNLCFFRFDDPIKEGKELTRCFHCNRLQHVLCLKSGPCHCND